MTLNPEDLNVTSFDTTPEALPGSDVPVIAPTTNPTAATRCFICPPISYDCW